MEYPAPPPPPAAHPLGGPLAVGPPQPGLSSTTDAWGDDRSVASDDSMDAYDRAHDPYTPTKWLPITEDLTEACGDELDYIEKKGAEHSALEHEHWQKETFTDLEDPEMVPGESGRIEWTVKTFNGTKEAPNNELIRRSPVVRIGGLDWQIKLHPRGHDSQFLSVYLECVSMVSPDWVEIEKVENPPFPFLEGAIPEWKRRSVAAQFSVVMYNPTEPRVNEHRTEAHQFHKRQADYGWVRFSQRPRGDFHLRQHLQRQAILRNDQLAFTAYVRIIHDPTGSLWEHRAMEDEGQPTWWITGLRPNNKFLGSAASALPLLHFAPFRSMVQELPPDTAFAKWLQPWLLKMYTRQISETYHECDNVQFGDAMELLWKVSVMFHTEYGSPYTDQWQDLVGAFHSDRGSVIGANRLNTKDYHSIQDAVNAHDAKSVSCPQLLTMELTRQEHDKTTRKWEKLFNKVRVDDRITVHGNQYTLFAFITHKADLMSLEYAAYVRPSGIGKGWYHYGDGQVTRLTEKQARDRHSGTHSGYNSPFSEVCQAVMYVRDNVAASAFEAPVVESWVPPFMRKTNPVTSLSKLEIQSGEDTLTDPPPTAMDDGSGPEEAEDASLELRLKRAAAAATPEPDRIADEDNIMWDVDDSPIYTDEEHDIDIDATGEEHAIEIDAKGEEHEIDIDATGATTLVSETTTLITEDPTLSKGTLSWLGGCHYDGQWKDGKKHGGGHYIDTNGDEYLGSFKDDLKDGFGKMVYAETGDVYNGTWKEDKHDGAGTLTSLRTGNVFEGTWQEGKKVGAYVLKGTVTEEDNSLCTICYEKDLDTAFYVCGHVVACGECATAIAQCPICRSPISARVRLYGVRLSIS